MFYNEDTKCLYVTSDDHGTEVFTSAGRTRFTRFISAGHTTEVQELGLPASVTRADDGSLSVSSKGLATTKNLRTTINKVSSTTSMVVEAPGYGMGS